MELGILVPQPVNPKNTLLAQSQTKKVSLVGLKDSSISLLLVL